MARPDSPRAGAERSRACTNLQTRTKSAGEVAAGVLDEVGGEEDLDLGGFLVVSAIRRVLICSRARSRWRTYLAYPENRSDWGAISTCPPCDEEGGTNVHSQQRHPRGTARAGIARRTSS